jgi:hypothetical protein
MSDAHSSAPHGTPRVPTRLVEGLKAAIADPERRAGAYVDLSVAGGVRGEAYEFEFHVDATGRTTSRLRDELHERHREARDLEPDRSRFTALAEAIDVEALLHADAPAARFPPDSVIGRLEISDGEQTVRFTFLADEEQAERSMAMASEPLRKAVGAVYETAAKVLGDDQVRP